MSKLAYHVQHFKKGACAGLARHNWEKRGETDKHSNPDIDPSRSHLNMVLERPEGSLYMAVKNDLAERCTGRVTSASNWISESTTYAPEGMTDPEELRAYFSDVLDWHKQEFGEANVKGAAVHLDETSPHMHTDVVPLTDDGRLSAKEVFARKELFKQHDGLAAYLKGRGWDIQRGDPTQGENVHALSVKEYKQQAEVERKAIDARMTSLEAPGAVLAVQAGKTITGKIKLRRGDYKTIREAAEMSSAARVQSEDLGKELERERERADRLAAAVPTLEERTAQVQRERALKEQAEKLLKKNADLALYLKECGRTDEFMSWFVQHQEKERQQSRGRGR